jgi:hypothetical protein
MAAGEDHAELVVLESLVVSLIGPLHRPLVLGVLRHELVTTALPANRVDRLVSPGRYEPRPRVRRHPVARPRVDGDGQTKSASMASASLSVLLGDALLVHSDSALLKMDREVQAHASARCRTSLVRVQLPETLVDGQIQLKALFEGNLDVENLC